MEKRRKADVADVTSHGTLTDRLGRKPADLDRCANIGLKHMAGRLSERPRQSQTETLSRGGSVKRIIVVALTCAACSESSGPEQRAGSPAFAIIVKGDNQVDTVAKTLRDTIVVKITDSLSVPVPNAVVSWIGDGEPFVTASATNAAGEARNYWKLGTKAGGYRLEARWINPVTGAARTLGTIRATAVPGSPSRLAYVMGDSIMLLFVGQNAPVRAGAWDAHGNEIPAEQITVDPIQGLTVSGRSVTPSAEAVYRTRIRIGGLSRGLIVYGNRDLRAHNFSLTFSCVRTQPFPTNEMGLDSVGYALTTDSVRFNAGGAQTNLYFRGTRAERYSLGTQVQRIDTINESRIVAINQRADSLELISNPGGVAYAKRASVSPLSYEAPRGWCQQDQRSLPIVLRAQ